MRLSPSTGWPSPELRKCFGTICLIETVHSGVEGRIGRVTCWPDGQMVLRWAAAAALETARSFRQIVGHEDLWMLAAALRKDQLLSDESNPIDKGRVAAVRCARVERRPPRRPSGFGAATGSRGGGGDVRLAGACLLAQEQKGETMQKPARRHYSLPESYLAGFTATGSVKDPLYVFDIELPDPKPRRLRPSQIAVKKDFHRIDWPGVPIDWLEKQVFAKFESEVAPVIADVVKHKDFIWAGLDLLLQFAALTAVRIPQMRDAGALLLEEDAGMSFEKALARPESWDLILRWSSDTKTGLGQDEVRCLLGDPGLRKARPQYWHFLNTVMTRGDLLELLAKRRWDMYFSLEGGPDFICSDNPFSLVHAPPVVPFRTSRFDERGTVATFPLHRRAALVGTFGDDNGIVDADAKAVKRINTSTIRSAFRSLYSPGDDFVWLGGDSASYFESRQRAKRGEFPFLVQPECSA